MVNELLEFLRLVCGVEDHANAFLPARHSRVGHRPARVTELAKVRRERERVLGENGEDRADDVLRKVCGGGPGAQ